MTSRGRGIIGVACVLAACDSFAESTTPPDGGAPSDAAGVDATDATDGGDARTFCERQSPAPFLCDDFEAVPFAFKWAEKAQSGGGITENVAGTFVARGGSDVAGQAWAYLKSDLGTTTNEIELSFTMRNLAIGIEDLELGGIKVDGAIPYSCMLRSTADGALSIWEVGATDAGTSDALQKIPFEKTPNPLVRTRFKMHWTIAPAPSIRVYVGDDPAPAVDRMLTPTLRIGTRQVLFGATYFTKPGIAVELDDVVIVRR